MTTDNKTEIDQRLREKYPDVFAQPKPAKPKGPKIEQALCLDCKQPYQKTTFFILGVKREYSGGRCPACNQKRYEIETAENEKLLQSAIQEQKLKWWKTGGVPRDYLVKSFENFDKKLQPVAYKACVNYADKFPIAEPHGYRSFILYSDKSWGTGKTHLACSIIRRILQHWAGEGTEWDEDEKKFSRVRRNPVYFISEPDMFNMIRATYDYTLTEKQQRPSEANIINGLISVPLLVMDDMGKQEVSDSKFVQRTLFTIIDARYRSGLPMVITANLNPQTLKLHLGGGVGNDAAYSRLKSMVKGQFMKSRAKITAREGYKK